MSRELVIQDVEDYRESYVRARDELCRDGFENLKVGGKFNVTEWCSANLTIGLLDRVLVELRGSND